MEDTDLFHKIGPFLILFFGIKIFDFGIRGSAPSDTCSKYFQDFIEFPVKPTMVFFCSSGIVKQSDSDKLRNQVLCSEYDRSTDALTGGVSSR